MRSTLSKPSKRPGIISSIFPYFFLFYLLMGQGKWGWGNGTTQRIGNNGGGAEQEGEMSIGMRRVGRDMGRETLV
jgi:hypothetical protein